jgi:hypothetical protein
MYSEFPGTALNVSHTQPHQLVSPTESVTRDIVLLPAHRAARLSAQRPNVVVDADMREPGVSSEEFMEWLDSSSDDSLRAGTTTAQKPSQSSKGPPPRVKRRKGRPSASRFSSPNAQAKEEVDFEELWSISCAIEKPERSFEVGGSIGRHYGRLTIDGHRDCSLGIAPRSLHRLPLCYESGPSTSV